MRKPLILLTVATVISILTVPALAQLGTNTPPNDDTTLKMQREMEAGTSGSGIFDVPQPDPSQLYQPARRVPRAKFGVVGPFMPNGLSPQDLDALVFPGTSPDDKSQLSEGLQFFTMFHTPGEGGAPDDNGVGPLNNQPACIGCHLNSAEAVKSKGLLGPNCPGGSPCASNVTRAARSTPTNFEFTSLDANTGGGRPPDNNDALNNTGKTAAFTTFGDFSKTLTDTAMGAIGCFDPLDGASHSCLNQIMSIPVQAFGGLVQHVRPSLPADVCVPKPLPPLNFDKNLTAGSNSGDNPNGFRRSVGERAGPPYIGRGLMEAVPTADITDNADPAVENGHSSLGNFVTELCPSNPSLPGCISGKANMIPRSFAVNANGTVTGNVGGVGRFGLRANGAEILQFVVGGLQGELSFTSLFNPAEINFPTLFPGGMNTTPPTREPDACFSALSEQFGQPVNLSTLEVHLSEPFSIRNLIRNTAPPDFGEALRDVLYSAASGKRQYGDGKKDRDAAMVQRGAELFGIDLEEFAKRTIGNKAIPATSGPEDNAIATDRKLNCVGCHTPIQRTGLSPTKLTSSGVGAANLSYKWAPIFSDLLIHKMPVIDAERETTNGLPRDVVAIPRRSSNDTGDNEERGDDHGDGRIANTLDVPRNLADDTFLNAKAFAEGSEFRTAPLMGLGRVGPPFLHDARVYLSKDTVKKSPAGTVTTNRDLTNAPLVVRSVDDAILAAIELHDLPAPDDKKTPKTPGAGCPVPQETTNVDYGPSPNDVICPAYDSATSQTNRSDAREVICRFRQLSVEDHQAVIEFLKQL